MAISNASNVIGRFRNGEYRCYKDVFLTETECQEHYSLTVNASGDIIIVMRNISDPYFGSYLISVYRKSDDKIDTLWIKVYKEGKLSTFSRTLEYVIWAVSRGCNRRSYIYFIFAEFLLRDRSPTAMTPTVSLPHVSHTHTKDHVTTEENKPSEQSKSNGTVKNHISRPSKFTARWNTYFY